MVAGLWARNQLSTQAPDESNDADAEFDEAAAALGLVAEGTDAVQSGPESTCYLWPCNLPAWNLWCCLETQWRMGVNGREGLDYSAVIGFMEKVAGIKGREFAAMFAAIQAMERKVLAVWGDMRA